MRLAPQKRPEQVLRFFVASATDFSFEPAAYDFILCSDGIHGWMLSQPEKNQVVFNIQKLLKPNASVLFVDYLKPAWMEEALDFFCKTNLTVHEVEYMGYRVWYKFEAMFKAVKTWPVFSHLLRSITVAKALRIVGLIIGRRGSNHMVVWATNLQK